MSDGYLHIEKVISLIRDQQPERTDLIEDLKRQIRTSWLKRAYIPLVNDDNPNQRDSEWQYEESIVLEDEEEGTLVLDVLKGGRVGGIELLDHIPHT